MKLVDMDLLVDQVKTWCRDNHDYDPRVRILMENVLLNFILRMPTVENTTAKYAHWEYDGDCFHCTNCKSVFGFIGKGTKYGPECGAYMYHENEHTAMPVKMAVTNGSGDMI